VRPLPTDGAIRTLRPSDLPAALDLSGQAGWNQTPDDWRRLLDWEPEGCFALDLHGRLGGTVTTTCYGARLAWIGMLLVDAALRRRGFGRRLLLHALTWLEEKDVRAVMLDATPLGQALYESLGFRQQDALDRWQGLATAAGRPRCGPTSAPVNLSPALLDLDRRAFGLDRARLLRGLHAAPDGRSYRLGDDQRTDGYVLVRPGARRWHIGPFVANSEEAAAGLLQSALAALEGQAVEMDIARDSAATSLARDAGLAPVRPFLRMLRGGPPPTGDPTLLYATAGPEIG
jgi:GNAT superfamily N-acetyltransferase